jgi:hypothetical protein
MKIKRNVGVVQKDTYLTLIIKDVIALKKSPI